MSHNDEQTPIRERWTAQPAGKADEATAGALLRAAAEHGPIGEKRLAEIHARLLRTQRMRAFARPAPRLLRKLVFAAGFVLCGGALSASVMHVMRRPPKQPEIAPAPAVETHKKTARRPTGKRGPVETVTPAEAPAAEVPEAPTPTEIAPAAPSSVTPAIPAPPSAAEVQVLKPASTSSPRLPNPRRRMASKEAPSFEPVVVPAERPAPARVESTPAPSNPWLAPTAMPSPPLPQAPIERPVPTAQPARPAAPAIRPEPSRLARESRWLASAIAKLRQEGQPEQALAILDQHHSELSSGALAAESNATRIEALLRLGRNGQALTLLDGQSLSAQGLEREMLVARAELRADNGRASAALHDFNMILSAPGRVDGITERALYGRATCRAKSGDREGARGDFSKYLQAFPQGRFVQEARSALSQQLR
jgi:hypothetical protein